jgi:Mce-associated membrane protein
LGRVTTGLSVAVAALAAGTFWLGSARREAREAAADRRAAVAAGATYGVNLLSLGHRTVAQDIRRVLETSTGPARDAFARTAGRMEDAIRANKVVQTGAVRGAGLVSMGRDRRTAEVLVAGDAVIRWEDGRKAGPEERFHRWRIELTKIDGAWLVSRSEPVP